MNTRRLALFLSISTLGLANLGIWGYYQEVSGRVLKVSFLDIGQGDSIYIESPAGRQVLIDSGPGSKVLSELGEMMPWHDRSIDILLETHPDADHNGAFGRVLDAYEVTYFLENGHIKDTATYKALRKKVTEVGVSTILLKRGMKINLGDGVVLEILYPDRDVSHVSDTNDSSVVAKLSYKGHSFLLTGDATIKVEGRVISYGAENLASDVLKLGHHGSRTSTGAAFLAAVNPAYAIISVGAGNQYGHPHPQVVARVLADEVELLRTDQDGRVTFLVGRGGEMAIETQK